MAEKQENMEFQEKLRRHRNRVRNRIIITAAAVLIALFAYILYQNHRSYSGASLDTTANFLTDEDEVIYNFRGNILRYDKDEAQLTNTRGETLWTHSYDMQQPILDVAGEVFAIADYQGFRVCIFDREGLCGTFTTEIPIQSISVSDSGKVAVVMNDSSASWIRLYSEEGREIAYFVRTMAEHGYPVAVAVSPGGDLLCLSSLMVEDASVKTYISFYNFGSKGKDAVDHYVGGFDYPDEIFPVIRFIKNNICIGISDSRLVYYEGSAAPKNGTNNLISEEIRGVYYSDQYIGLLFNDATGESQYRLDLYDSEGNRKHSVGITMDFTDLQINGDYIYINNDSELQIYTTGGRRIFDGSLGVSIRALIPSSRPRRLTVVTESTIDTVTLD